MPVRMEVQVDCLNNCCLTRLGFHPPGEGGTRSIHDGWGGGATYFFGLKIYMLATFLGQEICHIFFWVLSPSELFVSGFRCDQWIRKIFIQTFFCLI